MQRPDMPHLIAALRVRGCAVDPGALTYFVGAERVTPREDGRGLPRWMELLFAALLRNSTRLTDYLQVPRDQLIELGRQIAI
jgi:KUP system potassium uptake protein